MLYFQKFLPTLMHQKLNNFTFLPLFCLEKNDHEMLKLGGGKNIVTRYYLHLGLVLKLLLR